MAVGLTAVDSAADVRRQLRAAAPLVLLSAGVFATDLLLPESMIGSVAHTAPVLLSLWSPGRRTTIAFAIVGTVLAPLGLALTMPSELGPWIHRVLSLLLIWVTAWLVLRRKEFEHDLRESRERFQEIAGSVPDVFWVYSPPAGRLLYVSPSYERVWGRSRRELYADPEAWVGMIHPKDRDAVRQAFRDAVDGRRAFDATYRILTTDGSTRWIHNVGHRIGPSDAPPTRLIGVAEDITDAKRAERRYLELAAIVESSNEAIIGARLDGTITTWNGAAEGLFGSSAATMLGQSITRIVPDDRADESAEILDRLRAGESVADLETVRVKADGTRLDVELSAAETRDPAGQVIGMAAVYRDISSRKAHERRLEVAARELEAANQRLRDEASVDPLTELQNRRGLDRILTSELDRASRLGTSPVAILIDCDDFKLVNENAGHAAGDAVLRVIADQLREHSRSTDHVARIGGDEFLVLLPETRLAEGLRMAERIRLAIANQPFASSDGVLAVTVSLGVAKVPPGSLSIEEILTATRHSMQVSKSSGKNRTSGGEIDRAMMHPAGDAIDGLRRGDGLRAVFQPIVDLFDDVSVGHEALSRGPEGLLERPDDFFLFCTEHGILTTVDLHCARTCLEKAASRGLAQGLHVNLFPSTLLDTPPDRVLKLFEPMQQQGEVCIEISEQQFIGNPGRLAPRLADLRAAGIRIAIDDVGFGRSSLESLIVLDPDVIKIDRRLVTGAAHLPGQRRNLRRLVQVSRTLGCQVVAEGIETEDDLGVVRELGVRHGQGYLFGKPA